jgi:hypothetical protein
MQNTAEQPGCVYGGNLGTVFSLSRARVEEMVEESAFVPRSASQIVECCLGARSSSTWGHETSGVRNAQCAQSKAGGGDAGDVRVAGAAVGWSAIEHQSGQWICLLNEVPARTLFDLVQQPFTVTDRYSGGGLGSSFRKDAGKGHGSCVRKDIATRVPQL